MQTTPSGLSLQIRALQASQLILVSIIRQGANASYGDFYEHVLSNKCAGAGQKLSEVNVTGGCTAGY